MLSNRSESDAIAGPRLQSERTLASSHSALGRLADGILARLAQSRVMLFDAEQDTTRARLEAGALLLDIRPAGFAHSGDLHERSLAWLSERLEIRLDAFGEPASSRLDGGAQLLGILAARPYGGGILAECRGGREQHKYCKSQTGLPHLSLQSFERPSNQCHDTVIQLRSCDRCGKAASFRLDPPVDAGEELVQAFAAHPADVGWPVHVPQVGWLAPAQAEMAQPLARLHHHAVAAPGHVGE